MTQSVRLGGVHVTNPGFQAPGVTPARFWWSLGSRPLPLRVPNRSAHVHTNLNGTTWNTVRDRYIHVHIRIYGGSCFVTSHAEYCSPC